MKKLVFLAVLLVFVGSACADITTGLVGWWKMDAADPGDARLVKDSSGFGNDGTMGGSDQWLAGGGIDFDGGSWGASGIVFANGGADLVADMGLTSQVTISYTATWDAFPGGTNYPYDGRDSANLRVLSSECPTGSMHIRDHKGGADMWVWSSFDETSAAFIFQKNGIGKNWGDYIQVTTTVNFDTGLYKMYVDGQIIASSSGKTGSFADLQTFTIGRTLWAEMDGSMNDFRIFDRELSADDVAELVPEPATLALLGLGALTLVRRKRS